MPTTIHPHGEVTRTIRELFSADPFNNVGRWCDISRKSAEMFVEDFGLPLTGRGWSVRGYESRAECGCHLYHVTHEIIPTGIVAVPFKSLGCDAPHTEMMNLY